MIIIAGKLYVSEDVRDQRVADHLDLVARARRQPGCLDLVIAADPLEGDRINNFEVWASEQHLADWRKIANPPKFTYDRER
jgi:quinol monooxygenase YgiN